MGLDAIYRESDPAVVAMNNWPARPARRCSPYSAAARGEIMSTNVSADGYSTISTSSHGSSTSPSRRWRTGPECTRRPPADATRRSSSRRYRPNASAPVRPVFATVGVRCPVPELQQAHHRHRALESGAEKALKIVGRQQHLVHHVHRCNLRSCRSRDFPVALCGRMPGSQSRGEPFIASGCHVAPPNASRLSQRMVWMGTISIALNVNSGRGA